MDKVAIIPNIPQPLHDAARRLADRRKQPLDQVLTEALSRVTVRGEAGIPVPDDLGHEFARARSWPELQGRLMVKGFRLRERDGTLSLHDYPGGVHLCGIEALGVSPAALALRFCRPFPPAAGAWAAAQGAAMWSEDGPGTNGYAPPA